MDTYKGKSLESTEGEEPLINSDHNQINVEINVKSERKIKKRTGEISTKVIIKI